ncbi:hypothetical protein CUN67_13815 [Pantoea cypripedii]|uniref:Uncharacterized protein n=1 Tax=Pantoea cypripedii TaxID=55209 RepID=A0A6B9GBT4_PANCY|nr:hypothetical protein CUN67_13815 [Pantoea cypripedii]
MLISRCNKDHSNYLRTVILPRLHRFFDFIQQLKLSIHYVILAVLIYTWLAPAGEIASPLIDNKVR